MNNMKIAAALRTLADAFETPGETVPEQPAAEPQKRGRGRPVKGEEAPAPDVAALSAASNSQAATTAAAVSWAATPTTAPASDAADPFASTASIEDVRAALTALKVASSQDKALSVLKKAGSADNITELSKDKYGQVVAAVNVELRIIENGKAKAEVDPFEVPAAKEEPKAEAKALTIEDVKAAVVSATKRTGTDIVQKLVMDHGGKATNPETGAPGPSLKAIPAASYGALIKAISDLPSTK